MALTLKSQSVDPIVTKERTFEAVISVRLGETPMVTVRRQQVEMQGDQIKQQLTDAIVVKRDFTKVAEETVEVVPGLSVKVGQLWEACASLFDKWANEDDPDKIERAQEEQK